VKKLLIIGMLLFGTCSQIIDDYVSPMNCYCVTLLINSGSGAVINTETIFEFVYIPEAVDKWMQDQGVNVQYDTINNLTTIQMIHCIEPDSKGQLK